MVAQPTAFAGGLKGPPAIEHFITKDGFFKKTMSAETPVVAQILEETRAKLIELENKIKTAEERLSVAEKFRSELPDAIAKSVTGKFVPTSKKKELEDLIKSARDVMDVCTESETSRGKIALDAMEAITNQFTNQKEQFCEQKSQFEEIYDRAKTFAKYEQLDNYFAKKMSAHKKLHHNWLILFVGIIAFSLSVVWDGRDIISGWLPVWTKDEFTFGKSVLLIVPFLGVSWILRICMRLSMLNLQLSEDADNKTVLLRTLAALESDDVTKLEKEQRLVAYNAIFRSSLPENSSLDIAQPNIAELAKFGK